jgi:propionate catabolism operon transcriptional regulator
LAHKGTLFLDEIAELPLGLQAKLLRVLQEKEIRKLGDDINIPVDVRFIAASNVDLQQKVQENKFRQDLLYRLDILRLFIPPLRELKDDIKEIAGAILANFTEVNEPTIRITEDAVAELIKYSWPGNVRELRNICERLTVLCTRNQITKQDVRDVFDRNLLNNSLEGANGISRDPVEKEFKKKMTQKEMAEMLGISRTTLWRKMKQNANKA